MLNDVEEILLSAEDIENRIKELAEKISSDYKGKELVLISVLKGSMFFTADLIRHISIPVILDFIAISSYGEATETSGVARIIKDLEENIENRHILIVEDIVDTGLTLGYLMRTLKLKNPASIKVCTLLDKPVRRILEVPIDYKGFEIEDKFVVGYGLDFLGKYRHMHFICTLKPDIIGIEGRTA
ncbi:MAG: hypoxanthine phosphoribosyltransferase [Firmicutes bacterium]|nr:hypoxanthine phosphoribosyltransferase [Bacillota bacterium]